LIRQEYQQIAAAIQSRFDLASVMLAHSGDLAKRQFAAEFVFGAFHQLNVNGERHFNPAT
jgi:hypothetical protein